jgi:hypothetical protein
MAVSNLPLFFNMLYTQENGSLTANAHLYNDQLSQVLQQIVEQMNNGFQMPQKTTAQITAYGADASVPVGTTWFNTSLAKLQVKTAAATIETITSV